jgi:hypothetical protein
MIYADVAIKNFNTIGLSYVRYWLPLFVLSVPFIALGIINLSKIGKKWHAFVLLCFCAFLFYQSYTLVMLSPADGLFKMQQNVANYQNISQQVNSATEPNAVIVSVRQDKIFFPDRKVIQSFTPLTENAELLPILSDLVKNVPVYYFSSSAISYQTINNLKLESVGVVNGERLYHLISVQ